MDTSRQNLIHARVIHGRLSGRIDTYTGLKDAVKDLQKPGQYPCDLRQLITVDHLLEDRFHDVLEQFGGDSFIPDERVMRQRGKFPSIGNFRAMVIPESLDAVRELRLTSYFYIHREKTALLRAEIPHGAEHRFTPQEIWDAHQRVFHELLDESDAKMVLRSIKPHFANVRQPNGRAVILETRAPGTYDSIYNRRLNKRALESPGTESRGTGVNPTERSSMHSSLTENSTSPSTRVVSSRQQNRTGSARGLKEGPLPPYFQSHNFKQKVARINKSIPKIKKATKVISNALGSVKFSKAGSKALKSIGGNGLVVLEAAFTYSEFKGYLSKANSAFSGTKFYHFESDGEFMIHSEKFTKMLKHFVKEYEKEYSDFDENTVVPFILFFDKTSKNYEKKLKVEVCKSYHGFWFKTGTKLLAIKIDIQKDMDSFKNLKYMFKEREKFFYENRDPIFGATALGLGEYKFVAQLADWGGVARESGLLIELCETVISNLKYSLESIEYGLKLSAHNMSELKTRMNILKNNLPKTHMIFQEGDERNYPL